jgi:hypothetical protein
MCIRILYTNEQLCIYVGKSGNNQGYGYATEIYLSYLALTSRYKYGLQDFTTLAGEMPKITICLCCL